MKVLIVGSQGFIGSNLVRSFKEDGNEVLGITSGKGISNLLSYSNDTDIDIKALSETLLTFNPDVCINASGPGSVAASFENKSRDFKINVVNVYTLLDTIKSTHCKCKFVNLSSAAVYGDAVADRISESHSINPQSPYGFHKYLGENICLLFHTMHQIPTVSLRMFSVYGPGLKRQLFWDIYQKSKHDKIIKLLGSGNETRDFIYIDDLIEAIKTILSKSEFKGESINVGSEKNYTIKEAASVFCGIIDSSLRMEFSHKTREGDPSAMRGDFSLLKNLGFTPCTDLKTGLTNYFEWLHLVK